MILAFTFLVLIILNSDFVVSKGEFILIENKAKKFLMRHSIDIQKTLEVIGKNNLF